MPPLFTHVYAPFVHTCVWRTGEEPTVNVLQDLEYLLSDLDIARDFYILKGWPLLLSTLAHDKSRPLRSLAAHCIGNAVKNQEEFHDWAVAKGPGDKDVLEVVLDAIKEEVGGGAPGGGGFLVKLVYAAGSLLRGNPVASHRFVELGGGDVVGSLLKVRSRCMAFRAARELRGTSSED